MRGATRSRTSPGGRGGHRYGLQGDFCSEEAAAGPACGPPFPRGTAAQALVRRGPTVYLVALHALAAQLLGLVCRTG